MDDAAVYEVSVQLDVREMEHQLGLQVNVESRKAGGSPLLWF